jgi:hypothetical protein
MMAFVHALADLRAGRTRAVGSILGAIVVAMLVLPLLAAGAQRPAHPRDARRFALVRRSALVRPTSVCSVPRLTSLVLSLARERAAKAHCKIRLEGASVSLPPVQTIRAQTPAEGHHARVLTLWLNPLCSGSAAAGPGLNEPLITAGPTELVSGLYVVGGPLTRWSEPRCKPHPGEPRAGTITVTDAANGAIVASQAVSRGQLATIPLAPGKYTIRGTFANATINERLAQSFPTTVEVSAGKTVRQDVFLGVP